MRLWRAAKRREIMEKLAAAVWNIGFTAARGDRPDGGAGLFDGEHRRGMQYGRGAAGVTAGGGEGRLGGPRSD